MAGRFSFDANLLVNTNSQSLREKRSDFSHEATLVLRIRKRHRRIYQYNTAMKAVKSLASSAKKWYVLQKDGGGKQRELSFRQSV